jgi:hypothetical protein
MAYEIQEWCLCGGWTNTWSWEDDKGNSIPTTYQTKDEAEADLDDFFADCIYAMDIGNTEDIPDREEFRIVEIQDKFDYERG